ncbi:Ig-like domain repeat protein [Nocardioides sp. BSK12Z-3]|nr:Ig-like domain repeat protein [Nocardioides bruguierae]
MVVIAEDPGTADADLHYELDEGTGTTAASTGTDASVGDAVLTGDTGWSENGVEGGSLDLVGGENTNAVDLPDDLLAGADDFTTSFWVRPDALNNWTGLFHLGTGLGGAGGFFQIQTQTQADGNTGLAATFKVAGQPLQERVYATPAVDVAVNTWNHVAFTREGSTGTLFLNGEPVASRDDLTIALSDVTAAGTENNWLGRNGFPDASFDGLVDEVRVWSSSLSATDVAALYADGTALSTTTTVEADLASPSPFAEPVTFTATVAADGATPEGSASLVVDGSVVGSPVTLTEGTATFEAVALNRGEHEVRVDFTADAGWRDSTETITHTVQGPPPGSGVPIRYAFDEGSGDTVANEGLDQSVGSATLGGETSWAEGRFGSAVLLPGGGAATGNQVALPNDIDAGMSDEFSISVWARPDALPNWVPLVQIGSSTDTFFLLQSNTQAGGPTGFAATFKAPGNANQERLTLGGDVPLNEWTHIVYTHSGTTGRIYFDGELQGERTDFTLDLSDVGVDGHTTANMIGGTSWPDGRYDGLVDEFRMFGYALTQEQIDELYVGPAPENEAPVGVEDSYETEQGTALEVDAPGVLGNDTDADGDTLVALAEDAPEHGSVDLAEDGSFTYTPDEAFSGEDTFTYTASDGTDSSEPVTVTITVTEVDPALVETTTSATVRSSTYGRPVRVDVEVRPGTATGAVEVLLGEDVLRSVDLEDGAARVGLGRTTLRPGRHELTVRYAGDETHAASSTTVEAVVRKAPTTLTVKARGAIERGQRLRVKALAQAPGQVTIAGKARVVVRGGVRSGRYVTTVRVRDGVAVLRLPRAVQRGRMTVRVAYLGNRLATRAADTKVVRVRR